MGESGIVSATQTLLHDMASMKRGHGHTGDAALLDRTAKVFQPIVDLLEKHGSMKQIRLLCEAGEKLPKEKVKVIADLLATASVALHQTGAKASAMQAIDLSVELDVLLAHWNEAALKALNTEGE